MSTLRAFHGDEAIKVKYVNRVMAHQAADNLVRGLGWSNGKGCAVGCTLEAYDHSRYPVELGIPEWLARVEDTLFEGMSENKSRTWPEKFLKAIPIGADLEQIKSRFVITVLENTIESMGRVKYDAEAFPNVKAAINNSVAAVKRTIKAHKSGDTRKLKVAESAARSAAESAAWNAESAAWNAARSAAWNAAWNAARSAESAARSAAESAESAAWNAARSAARSAAESAASAARSAASAAESAARSAAWNAAWNAAWSVRSAAESAANDYYADELLKLIETRKGGIK